MDREGGNKEKMRKCTEQISLHFCILSPFPHSLSISSLFPHSLSISSHPGCKDAADCATLISYFKLKSTWAGHDLPTFSLPQ